MDELAAPRRHRFDVDAYHRMAAAGILAEGARVELIAGEIVDMAPIGSDHAQTVIELNARLDPKGLRGRAIVAVQSPLRLDDASEPEPDLMLLCPRPGGYRRAHPTPADVLLLVEVAGASLAFDRDVKGPLYVRAGIAEFWLVDLRARAVHVHRRPRGDGWGETASHARGTLRPAALAEAAIDVEALFA